MAFFNAAVEGAWIVVDDDPGEAAGIVVTPSLLLNDPASLTIGAYLDENALLPAYREQRRSHPLPKFDKMRP